jgi:hypothetical protein
VREIICALVGHKWVKIGTLMWCEKCNRKRIPWSVPEKPETTRKRSDG